MITVADLCRMNGLRGTLCTFVTTSLGLLYEMECFQTASIVLQVEADTIRILLPNIIQGLSSDSSPDFQMANRMILAQLCSQSVLSESLLKGQLRNQTHFASSHPSCCEASDGMLSFGACFAKPWTELCEQARSLCYDVWLLFLQPPLYAQKAFLMIFCVNFPTVPAHVQRPELSC